MTLKTMVTWACCTLCAAGSMAAETETWYDSKGKVVRVSKAAEPPKAFVPAWVAREARRDAGVPHRRIGDGDSWPHDARLWMSGWRISGAWGSGVYRTSRAGWCAPTWRLHHTWGAGRVSIHASWLPVMRR